MDEDLAGDRESVGDVGVHELGGGRVDGVDVVLDAVDHEQVALDELRGGNVHVETIVGFGHRRTSRGCDRGRSYSRRPSRVPTSIR